MDPETSISIKQIRAARSLLAWSQQDLAKAANVAVSTVADFERGLRKPVPNNEEAIQKALENAGITFLSGGAIIGPKPPSLSSRTSGNPIRWIDATDLNQWADRRDCQDILPILLSKLAHATGPTSPHFPSGEEIQQGGWDGTTNWQGESEYIPFGFSGWEIGTQRNNIRKKADDDYINRTDPNSLRPNETFIFVTPRKFLKKNDWEETRKSLGDWRDVRVYNGTVLVHWIEKYPAIGYWLAKHLNKRPPGVRLLQDCWEEWSQATNWPLSMELVLTDRDTIAIEVLRWLRNSASTLAMQGESLEEVVAFVYASIMQLPEDVAEHYLSRCLVADTPEIARSLSDSSSNLIIVLIDLDSGLAERISRKGHHVILVCGENVSTSGNLKRLPRPSRYGIEGALLAGDLPDEKAKELARNCGRSLSILRRLLPGFPDRLPVWAQKDPPRSLKAAILAGAWDESEEGDRGILSSLGGISYQTLSSEIAQYAGKLDSPLRKVGLIWKVASPKDAWALLAKYFSIADIENYELAIINVLSAPDPRFSMEPEERWYSSVKGVKPQYSEFLRRGLEENLIMLALFGYFASAVPNVESRSGTIVHRLLYHADEQRWWSLSRDFRLLAEASPEDFFKVIRHSLDQEPPPIKTLFKRNESPLFGTEYLSNLLWALESLAWSTEYLGQISDLLAKLNELDTGGRSKNRPGNSLNKIFCLWLPQTNADFDQRLKVIDFLRKTHSVTSWNLMLGILPTGHEILEPSETTRWRDFPEEKEVVTFDLVDVGRNEIFNRLLEDVGTNIPRWLSLLGRWIDLPNRSFAATQLSQSIDQIKDHDDRIALWKSLRHLLHFHRENDKSAWALPQSELESLQKIYEKLTPLDPVASVSWLFETDASILNPKGDWQQAQEQLNEEREKVAIKFLKENGVSKLFSLTQSLENPIFLGSSLANGGLPQKSLNSILNRALSSEKKGYLLAKGIIFAGIQKNGRTWVENIFMKSLSLKRDIQAILTILEVLPFDHQTWDLVHDAGIEIESKYWKSIRVMWVTPSLKDVEFVIQKLLEAKRSHDALYIAASPQIKFPLPSELLIKSLLEAARDPEENPNNNRAVMFQHNVVETLKKLDIAQDVPIDKMIELEWMYLQLLEHSTRPAKVIMKALSERPNLFIELICAVYKPMKNDETEKGMAEVPSEEPSEQRKKVANQAYNLLRSWNVVPGTRPDRTIDGPRLKQWVEEARQMAAEVHRGYVADEKIGEVLAWAPFDQEYKLWPALPVRELIESFYSENLQRGIVIGVRNRRGVTTRGVMEGGGQEHDRSQIYKEYSKKAARGGWPQTSMVLNDLARSYEDEARWHDENAERMEWG